MGGRIMLRAATLVLLASLLLLLCRLNYAAPSLQPFPSQEGVLDDWDLGPGTRQGPVLNSVKKVYLRAFLKEMRKISEMITSPHWRLKKEAQDDEDELRVNRRGFDFASLDHPEVMMTALDKESPLPPSELVVRASQSLIRSPFGVFRLRPQDPYWIDMMHQVGK